MEKVRKQIPLCKVSLESGQSTQAVSRAYYAEERRARLPVEQERRSEAYEYVGKRVLTEVYDVSDDRCWTLVDSQN